MVPNHPPFPAQPLIPFSAHLGIMIRFFRF
jgi:hypothetical protein